MSEMTRVAERMAAQMDKAIEAALIGPPPAPPPIPPTNNASSKQEWMKANPEFKPWRHQGILSFNAWRDVGWVTEDGRFIPEGDSRFYGRLHLNSFGDTLYVVPPNAAKVGREYSTIC